MKISKVQHEFYIACQKDDLLKARELVTKGAIMTGLALGLAGSFPETYNVFDFLAANECPVDNDTWLYLKCNSQAHILVPKLFSAKRCGMRIVIQAGISGCLEPNPDLIAFAVEKIGMREEFFNYIAFGGYADQDGQLKLFKEVLIQFRTKPNKEMLAFAKLSKNEKIIAYIESMDSNKSNSTQHIYL